MRASFPVEFVGNFLGKSREAGDFVSDGEKISYGDAYEVAFESSEGLTQTVRIAEKAFDDAGDFDVRKCPKFQALQVLGDVNLRDSGGSFRPSQIRLVKPS